jgi:predicted nucleic acid-binding Zn finger protein
MAHGCFLVIIIAIRETPNYILSLGHGSITNVMEAIKIRGKGKHVKKYHIYKISKDRLHINDT